MSGHDQPTVTAVMPVLNDAAYLPAAVASVMEQQYPGLELIVAVGPSNDDSLEVARKLALEHPAMTVISNPAGKTASGLNRAITAATGDIIVRVDSHCVLPHGYIQQAVATMNRTGAANVGGIQDAQGDTPFEEAVALAMTSKFGVGNATFHYGGDEGETDTVYLGVFHAETIRDVGLFDEDLIRNQDYELNVRIRQAGHKVWFDPKLKVKYRPRPTLRRLASQYFQYGQWKREVLKRHPGSVRARQVVAPLAVVGIGTGLAGAALGQRWMLLAPATYAAAVTGAALLTGKGNPGETVRLAAIFPAMHMSWGLGFLAGPPHQPAH